MSCKICGDSACATWMHPAEELAEWESVESMTERELQVEVINLRRLIKSSEQEKEEALTKEYLKYFRAGGLKAAELDSKRKDCSAVTHFREAITTHFTNIKKLT